MMKEKSLNFLNSKWLMVALFAAGFLFFGNVNANAQNSPIVERIANFEELRDSFAPSNAKYDIVQDAIDYLNVLEQGFASNPNYLNDQQDLTGQNPLKADKLRKTHSTILAEYTAAELASFVTLSEEYTSGSNQNPQAAQKMQWILDANAY